MKINELWMRFKKDESNFPKKIYTLLAITIITFAMFIGSLFYISGQGSRLTITENEIAKEKEFINQYQKSELTYQNEFGNFVQPVKKNDVEKIQNDLIQKTKNYGLNVSSLNNIASTAPPISAKNPKTTETAQVVKNEGIEFEMGFVGTWEMSTKYIQELQKSPGLLSIRNFSMKPKPNTANLIETSLKYKIYLE